MKRTLLLWPLALACSSAALTEENAFSYALGPLDESGRCSLSVRYLSRVYANAYFYAGVLGDASFDVCLTPSDASLDHEGHSCFRADFALGPRRKGERITFAFGLLKEPHYPGIDLNRYYVYSECRFSVEGEQGLLTFEQEQTQELSRRISVYDPSVDARQAFDYHDAYSVSRLKAGDVLPSRKVGLWDTCLEYFNAYASPLVSPRAELRLINHQEDFAEVASPSGGYASLDLLVGQETLPGVGAKYRFKLAKPLYYSTLDYRASKTPISGEPCFLSDDLYLPLRNGHDRDVYTFHIHADGLGAYGDEVILLESACSDRNFFGPCDSAEYCVVGGGINR